MSASLAEPRKAGVGADPLALICTGADSVNILERVMTTHFITAEVAVQAFPKALQQTIETELRRQGEPLRWAVTQVEADQAQVEAVVLVDAEPVGAS